MNKVFGSKAVVLPVKIPDNESSSEEESEQLPSLKEEKELFSIRDFLGRELNERIKRKLAPQELLINLKLISKLEVGDKLNFKGVNGVTISSSHDWSLLPIFVANKVNGIFRRFFREDGRKNTLVFFYENIDAAIELLTENILTDKILCEEIVLALKDSLVGLKKDKVTYNEDIMYTSCLETLVSFSIISKLKKLKLQGLEVDLSHFK